MLKIGTINRAAIDAFKASWPCHGLPDNLDILTACFDARNGDLVDYEGCDENDSVLDLSPHDGPALLALIGDVEKVATENLGPGLI